MLNSKELLTMKNVVSSTEEVLLLNQSVIREYYNAVRMSSLGEYDFMKDFQRMHPLEFRRFSAVHRKRTRIKHCIAAMKIISEEVYFGTLTFNERKNVNKIQTKRKEAFKKLNAIFEYFVLVEEFGEENGRFHVHFIGTFKEDHNFNDLRRIWHSRQNLRKLRDNENVSQYLCKYMSKDLPRVRCNKPLVRLEKGYKSGLLMERDKFMTLGTEYQCKKIHFVNAFDFTE